MKRTTKNIIHFLIIGLMLVLIIAPSLLNRPPDMQNNLMQNQQQMQGSGNQAPPGMPNSNNGSNMQNGGTPPEMPNGQTPPDMPNGQTPPEKPNGEEPPGMQNNMPGAGQQPQQMDKGINAFSIAVCGLEFLILTIFLVYIIMSKANKYTFAETISTAFRKSKDIYK